MLCHCILCLPSLLHATARHDPKSTAAGSFVPEALPCPVFSAELARPCLPPFPVGADAGGPGPPVLPSLPWGGDKADENRAWLWAVLELLLRLVVLSKDISRATAESAHRKRGSYLCS